MTWSNAELVEVRLIGFPLDVYSRAQEHVDELIREFQLIAGAGSDDQSRHTVPRRLLMLIEQVTAEYAGVGDAPEATRDAALEAGEKEVDLTYHVPASVVDAAQRLGRMLDEADEFCRQGQHLLTLASPPEAVRFRRWYLDQFEDQIAGKPPVAWDDYPG